MKAQKPSYKLCVKAGNVKDVVCEVYLPEKTAGPVELCLYPKKDRSPESFPWKFSIHGEIKSIEGDVETRIQAQTVYNKHDSTTHWSHDISETLVIGEPIDLKITDFLTNGKPDITSNVTKGCFWITPCSILSPTKTIESSYTGDTTVKTIHTLEYTLENGMKLTFDTYFKRIKNENNNTIIFSELVAEYEIDTHSFDKIIDLKLIDELLMLVSFAARQRYMCVGWDANDSYTYIRFYRRNITVPKTKEKTDFFDRLIDKGDIEKFIGATYKKYIAIRDKNRGLIRNAINAAIPKPNHTFESSFVMLYSAIESLVSFFQKKYPDSGKVLIGEEWDDFRKDIENHIKQLELHFNKKQFIYDRLGGLNCHPFSIIFNKMCQHYQVDLQDLWPISKGGRKKKSLSWIRNRLTHGQIFNSTQQYALISAKEHLRWILERLILSVLGWPIERSHVSRKFLSSNMACYKDWEKDRDILSDQSQVIS